MYIYIHVLLFYCKLVETIASKLSRFEEYQTTPQKMYRYIAF